MSVGMVDRFDSASDPAICEWMVGTGCATSLAPTELLLIVFL